MFTVEGAQWGRSNAQRTLSPDVVESREFKKHLPDLPYLTKVDELT